MNERTTAYRYRGSIARHLRPLLVGWQLLRQNGRILLRLDELENRLNELELGGANEPEGLSIGTEAPPIELPDLKGERKSLAQFRGQPALLIFFSPGSSGAPGCFVKSCAKSL